MSRQLVNRLVRIVGEADAHELLETPNFQLGGRTPLELIDQGNLRPVEILIADMEARERSRRDFITVPHHADFDEIDHLAADPLLDRLPQRRHTRGAGRLFAILDEIEQGGMHA